MGKYSMLKLAFVHSTIFCVVFSFFVIGWKALGDEIARYDRDDWPHWIDADGDCQDTRAEILIRDNTGVIGWKTAKHCQVVTGRWVCPYTGQVFTHASDVDIDHVVPLKWAHEHGGDKWDEDKRRAFANDPVNLLTVDDGTNSSKGSKGPSEWLPEIREFRSEYLEQWGVVVEKYDLR